MLVCSILVLCTICAAEMANKDTHKPKIAANERGMGFLTAMTAWYMLPSRVCPSVRHKFV